MINKVTNKSMLDILEARLKELEQKMAHAKAQNEKHIYAEAIAHCIHDMKKVRASATRRKIRRIILTLLFVGLILLSWKLFSEHEADVRALSDENQSIGKAVSDVTNN